LLHKLRLRTAQIGNQFLKTRYWTPPVRFTKPLSYFNEVGEINLLVWLCISLRPDALWFHTPHIAAECEAGDPERRIENGAQATAPRVG
jgi:hypothetical protein